MEKQLSADKRYRRNRFAITVGDELPTGVLQLAKVQIAQKRNL